MANHRNAFSGFSGNNKTGIEHWGGSYGSAPANRAKNQKHPTVNDIDWRQLDEPEAFRLYHVGTNSGKSQALRAIIDARRESMSESEFKAWRHSLCEKF